jgi:hypothetical protein
MSATATVCQRFVGRERIAHARNTDHRRADHGVACILCVADREEELRMADNVSDNGTNKITKIVALRGMAKMIRDEAIKDGNTELANESIDNIAKALNEVLIRDGFVDGEILDDRS